MAGAEDLKFKLSLGNLRDLVKPHFKILKKSRGRVRVVAQCKGLGFNPQGKEERQTDRITSPRWGERAPGSNPTIRSTYFLGSILCLSPPLEYKFQESSLLVTVSPNNNEGYSVWPKISSLGVH